MSFNRAFFSALACLLLSSLFAQRSSVGEVERTVLEARAAGALFQPRPLFAAAADEGLADRTATVVDDALLLDLRPQELQAVLLERPVSMAMPIPASADTLLLDLYQVDITTADHAVIAASTGAPVEVPLGIHYRGMVRGVPGSLVAISVHESGVMGMIATGASTYTLGKVDDERQSTHILYDRSDLHSPPQLGCATPDDGAGYTAEQLELQPYAKSETCVRLYWEVDHIIYQGKGGMANTVGYISGLFHQSATLYANDGIDLMLSQLFVWDVPSPYTATSTGAMLDQFTAHRTSFNGDLAHLLGYAGGGGMAYLDGLCSTNTMHRMGYSGITGSYQEVPTYSWSVEIVTHEMGHQLGSRHTHACAWNGNDTPIDGCGQSAGYAEGDCPQGPIPAPAVGGTIMSYCHLSGSSINFANGFGPQPAAVMINAINAADCLSNCAPAECDAPEAPAVVVLTVNSAQIAWQPVAGAASYSLQHKLYDQNDWTTIPGITSTSSQINGLLPGETYQARVMVMCNGTTPDHSNATTFNTAEMMVGISDGVTSEESISVFPNPVQDILTVDLGDAQRVERLEITDAMGRLIVLREHPAEGTLHFSMDEHPAGFYLLRVVLPDTEVVRRFVVE